MKRIILSFFAFILSIGLFSLSGCDGIPFLNRTTSGKAVTEEKKTVQTKETTESRKTTAHVHSLERIEAVDGTCTEKGTIEHYECSSCHKLFSDAMGENEIATAEGGYKHNLEKHEYQGATYEEAGNIEYYSCTSCQKVFSAEGAEISLDDTVIPALTFYPEGREYDVLQSFDDATSVDTYFFSGSELSDDYALKGKSFKVMVGNADCSKLPVIMKKNGAVLKNEDWDKYESFRMQVYAESDALFYLLNKGYSLKKGYNIIEISKEDLLLQIASNLECYTAAGYFWCQVTGKDTNLYFDELIGILPAGYDRSSDYYPEGKQYITLQSFDEEGCVDTYFFSGSAVSDDFALKGKSFHAVSTKANWSALPIMVKRNGYTLNSTDWNLFESYMIYVYADSACTFTLCNKVFSLSSGYNFLMVTEAEMDAELANPLCYNGESGWMLFQLNGDDVSIYLDEFIGILKEGACADHSLIHHEAVAGKDCLTKGTIEYWECEKCDMWFADENGRIEVASLEAEYGDHVLAHHDAVTGADCLTAGTIEYWSCSVCGRNFTDEAATAEALSLETTAGTHILTHHDAVAGKDCLTKGTIEYWSCSACGKNFSDGNGAVEAENLEGAYGAHSYVKHDAVSSTYVSEGNIEYFTCSLCDGVFIEKEGVKEEATLADTVTEKIYYPENRNYDVLQDFDGGANVSVDTWFIAGSDSVSEHAVNGKSFHIVKANAAWDKVPVMMKKNGNILTADDWNAYEYFMVSIYAENKETLKIFPILLNF